MIIARSIFLYTVLPAVTLMLFFSFMDYINSALLPSVYPQKLHKSDNSTFLQGKYDINIVHNCVLMIS